MLVSGIHGSCAPIQHTGLRLALDDAYSLWRSCNFKIVIVHLCGSLPLLFPPSWLAMVSTQVGKYLHRVSQCDGAWWWLPLSGLPWIPACPATCSHFAWHHHPLSSSSIGDEFNVNLREWPSGFPSEICFGSRQPWTIRLYWSLILSRGWVSVSQPDLRVFLWYTNVCPKQVDKG